MSKKSEKIAVLIASWRGGDLDAHYVGYFECFNRGLFYEAHDVLEELWLADRHGSNGAFYKGLIQFAGAFVHMQKHTSARPRLKPAAALLRLALANLPDAVREHERLDVASLRREAQTWLQRLEEGMFETNPLERHKPPKLELESN